MQTQTIRAHLSRPIAAISFTACALLPAAGSAQGACRSPTDAEHASITRAQEIARQVVEQGLKNSPWELGDWQLVDVVSRNASSRAPIELCDELVAVKLTLRNDSDRAHALDSIIAAAQHALQTDPKASAAMFQAVADEAVSIRVFVNESYLFSPRPGKPGEVLAVAGVPFATREINRQSDGTSQATMELYLGDFATAKQHITSTSYVPYPFRRATKGPYFENLEIKVEGTPSSVDDVVRRIEWSKLGTVLTP